MKTAILAVLVCPLLACEPKPKNEAFPETCEDVQENAIAETGQRPANGTYTLYLDGDETQPWDAYCHNMNRDNPSEYLSVDEAENFSQLTALSLTSDAMAVAETTFRRLRIDPRNLEIDLLDTTFAETTNDGQLTLPAGATHLPAGFARFAAPNQNVTPGAAAKISLTGTPFAFTEAVAADEFFCVHTTELGTPNASDATSATQIAGDFQSVDLSAINTDGENETTWVLADCTQWVPTLPNLPAAATLPLEYTGQ